MQKKLSMSIRVVELVFSHRNAHNDHADLGHCGVPRNVANMHAVVDAPPLSDALPAPDVYMRPIRNLLREQELSVAYMYARRAERPPPSSAALLANRLSSGRRGWGRWAATGRRRVSAFWFFEAWRESGESVGKPCNLRLRTLARTPRVHVLRQVTNTATTGAWDGKSPTAWAGTMYSMV